MKFINYINELFDKPVKWIIVRNMKDDFQAYFQTDTYKRYVFDAMLESGLEEIWNIQFAMKNPNDPHERFWDITGSGDEIKVFATVVDIFKAFVAHYKPQVFYFAAKEPSRQKLYDRFAKIIQSKLNYKLETNFDDEKTYVFRKAGTV